MLRGYVPPSTQLNPTLQPVIDQDGRGDVRSRVAFPVEPGQLRGAHLVRAQRRLAFTFRRSGLVSVGVFAVLAEHLAGDRPGHHPVVVRAFLGAPELEEQPGRAVDVLATASESADIVVVGSRGLHGLKALGSVSERVAHQARSPCSWSAPPTRHEGVPGDPTPQTFWGFGEVSTRGRCVGSRVTFGRSTANIVVPASWFEAARDVAAVDIQLPRGGRR